MYTPLVCALRDCLRDRGQGHDRQVPRPKPRPRMCQNEDHSRPVLNGLETEFRSWGSHNWFKTTSFEIFVAFRNQRKYGALWRNSAMACPHCRTIWTNLFYGIACILVEMFKSVMLYQCKFAVFLVGSRSQSPQAIVTVSISRICWRLYSHFRADGR